MTATITDYEENLPNRPPYWLPVIVNRNGRENGGDGQGMANPRQERKIKEESVLSALTVH